jgi:hypothetical protein
METRFCDQLQSVLTCNGHAVANQILLGAKPAPRATQRVICGFVVIPSFRAPAAYRVARQFVVSAHPIFQSILPSNQA